MIHFMAAIFISYPRRYLDWVEVLHCNLGRYLRVEIFLDACDLASGRSWPTDLQAALDRAAQLVLVVTPEALASRWVLREVNAFLAAGKKRLHLLKLVATPLPPFLEEVEWVDFEAHDRSKYERGLAKLVAGLRGSGSGAALPGHGAIEIPEAPDPGLPPPLRGEIVDWLAPLLGRKTYRLSVEASLGLEKNTLDEYPSRPLAASAALVLAAGDEHPVKAALRFLDVLADVLGEDEPRQVARLEPLRVKLGDLLDGEPPSDLLDLYLRRLEADHRDLVPLVPDETGLELLDKVYVEVELRPEERTRGWGKGEERIAGRRLEIEELLALDPEEEPWVSRRWVLRGDPGTGKTTMLRRLASRLAARRAAGPQTAGQPEPKRRWVPVYEPLPRLMKKPGWLLDRIEELLCRAGHPARGLAATLDREGREGRLLLLLDGLDEVPEEDRRAAEGQIRELAGRWRSAPVVVTTRPIPYRPFAGDFREADLQPFDSQRRREFLGRWFGRASGRPDDERARRELRAIEADPGLRELAGNPLYLTLMALLLESDERPEKNRSHLYRQVLDLLLAGRHRVPRRPMEHREGVRRVLRYLAYGMTRDNRDVEDLAALAGRLYDPEDPEARAARRLLQQVARWEAGLEAFFDELAERTAILRPERPGEEEWRFLHRSFREALTAERLEEIDRGEGGRRRRVGPGAGRLVR